ncbi:MAG TPA: hypothetical protein VGE66_05795 [Chitinophagaceae bacterium]
MVNGDSTAVNADSAAENKLTFNGYLKDLQTLTFTGGFKQAVSSSLLHHRLNVKWKPLGTLTAAAEFRNRFFWGEEVKAVPGYADLLRNKNELVDLSKAWIDKEVVLHTNTERLWAEYHRERWNLRAGRQRINWGITTLWNPNDLFNTYNFLDFDYEERPGSDAVKGQYFFKDGRNVEAAVAFQGRGRSVGAVKYFVNTGGYDLQAIGGWYRESWVIGGGWAGSIGEAGFKGEAMYFMPGDSGGHFNGVVEGDYVLDNGWYGNVGGLFNSGGLNRPAEDWRALHFDLSSRNLMPVKWAVALTAGKEFTPLFSGSLTTVYAPGTNMLILFPSLKYSLVTNLDVDLVWQSFFAQTNRLFEDQGHGVFLRIRWSY